MYQKFYSAVCLLLVIDGALFMEPSILCSQRASGNDLGTDLMLSNVICNGNGTFDFDWEWLMSDDGSLYPTDNGNPYRLQLEYSCNHSSVEFPGEWMIVPDYKWISQTNPAGKHVSIDVDNWKDNTSCVVSGCYELEYDFEFTQYIIPAINCSQPVPEVTSTSHVAYVTTSSLTTSDILYSTPTPVLPTSSKSQNNDAATIIGVTVGIVLFISAIFTVLLFFKIRRKQRGYKLETLHPGKELDREKQLVAIDLKENEPDAQTTYEGYPGGEFIDDTFVDQRNTFTEIQSVPPQVGDHSETISTKTQTGETSTLVEPLSETSPGPMEPCGENSVDITDEASERPHSFDVSSYVEECSMGLGLEQDFSLPLYFPPSFPGSTTYESSNQGYVKLDQAQNDIGNGVAFTSTLH